MRSSDILREINRIEHACPVCEWVVGDLHVWPLLRVQLYTESLNQQLLRDEAPKAVRRIANAVGRSLRAHLRMARASWLDRSGNTRLRAADALFLSDGVSFVRVAGLWYDKIFDPIIDALRLEGLSTLLLTPMTQAHFPRRTPSIFVQPHLDRRRIGAMLFPGKTPRVRLDGAADELARLAERGLVVRPLTAAAATRYWRRLEYAARYFEAVLRKVRPKVAFVNTYYSLEGMAFVAACKRNGVPVSDVQHGIQGPHHIAYGSWAAVPESGFELLPDEFWVWGPAEQTTIDAWRPRSGTMHRPVIIGNPWLDLWRRADSDWVKVERQRAQGLCGDGSQKIVLVTLQWGLAEEETLKMIRAAQGAPADCRWWFRLHPVMAQHRAGIRKLLSEAGLSVGDVDMATDLPLHALLPLVDVHVTHSSSTVVEALEFGVPSIVTSDYGRELFSAELKAGSVSCQTTVEGIAAGVASTARRTAVPQRQPVSSVLAEVISARAWGRR